MPPDSILSKTRADRSGSIKGYSGRLSGDLGRSYECGRNKTVIINVMTYGVLFLLGVITIQINADHVFSFTIISILKLNLTESNSKLKRLREYRRQNMKGPGLRFSQLETLTGILFHFIV